MYFGTRSCFLQFTKLMEKRYLVTSVRWCNNNFFVSVSIPRSNRGESCSSPVISGM